MCLILVALRAIPGVALVVAANRDEFHARPAARAAFWQDRPDILAGRDLEAQGTWMGVARNGRFAAVTNYRGGRDANAAESRGMLVTRFLTGTISAGDYASEVARRGSSYSGFNLLADDGTAMWWYSNRCANRDGGPRALESGIHGLGNFLLDTPEVDERKAAFARAMDPVPSMEPLFGVLAGAKIVAPEYGTRCSTVLLRSGEARVEYAERAYDADGAEQDTLRYGF